MLIMLCNRLIVCNQGKDTRHAFEFRSLIIELLKFTFLTLQNHGDVVRDRCLTTYLSHQISAGCDGELVTVSSRSSSSVVPHQPPNFVSIQNVCVRLVNWQSCRLMSVSVLRVREAPKYILIFILFFLIISYV